MFVDFPCSLFWQDCMSMQDGIFKRSNSSISRCFETTDQFRNSDTTADLHETVRRWVYQLMMFCLIMILMYPWYSFIPIPIIHLTQVLTVGLLSCIFQQHFLMNLSLFGRKKSGSKGCFWNEDLWTGTKFQQNPYKSTITIRTFLAFACRWLTKINKKGSEPLAAPQGQPKGPKGDGFLIATLKLPVIWLMKPIERLKKLEAFESERNLGCTGTMSKQVYPGYQLSTVSQGHVFLSLQLGQIIRSSNVISVLSQHVSTKRETPPPIDSYDTCDNWWILCKFFPEEGRRGSKSSGVQAAGWEQLESLSWTV